MFKNRTISFDSTLLEAFQKMDTIDKKLLIVLNNNKFAGLLSAGDIQRAIIQNKPLTEKVYSIVRRNIRIARPLEKFEAIKQMMFDYRMELCPVVTYDGDIQEIYFWEDIFKEGKPRPMAQFELPVVVMAGGMGSRLKPLTNVIPKPLIPIGDKTIIEHIFERFALYGCNDFFISVNYKADLIDYYLKEQHLAYRLHYFKEENPLGTAGSLSLLKGKINHPFFVTNCDILIEQDYSEMLEYHRENKNEITVVAALKHFPIPYGIIETGENGYLNDLIEKPELTFKINSGMYILEPHLLEEIPENTFFHITQLIQIVKQRKGLVGVFPVSEKSWKDIGNWNDYQKSMSNRE